QWTAEEDALLRAAVSALPYGAWAKVAEKVPGRSERQCRRRWVDHLAHCQRSVESSHARRGSWTEEENERLRELVAQYGFLWTTIAQHMGTRTATQCRDRWRSSMEPGRKPGRWTGDEDELLRRGVEQYGRRWKMVASVVPGRTPRQCSARWNAVIDP
ncbi:Homeodomain-like protein, partial [Syncephalis pseudoplumigaleata]